ncbi:MAG TPA: PAS domain S-box protein, partial [Patescibacteria group bacterium]|nr:PAS domain S-box protein [Patescibacteria group bacterium]
MTQILNSLVIAKGLDTQHALEEIMVNNLEGYVMSFLTYPIDRFGEIDREPDLIFIDGGTGLSGEDIQRILKAFPRKTYVVLDDNPGMRRRIYLNMGMDEVMSLTDLKSELGKHLLEKLLALKDLAAAEAKVAQGEERFRGIIEHSNDIIMMLDAEGTILYGSPAFTRQLGYEIWEVLGQPFFSFVHASDKVEFETQFRR